MFIPTSPWLLDIARRVMLPIGRVAVLWAAVLCAAQAEGGNRIEGGVETTVTDGFDAASEAVPMADPVLGGDISEETLDVRAEEIAEEIPEEILRTEIITAARSPLTGKPLSAADYAQLQAELAAPAGDTLVSEDLRYLVFLLQVRRAFKPILPFVR